MGTTIQSSSGTQQATPTPEETALNQRNLRIAQATEGGQTQMQQSALGLGNQLLTSFGDKNSQMWQSLIGGVTPQQQQSMISEQERYLQPQLQAQGIYDSGTAAAARLRSATDLSNQNAQFNVGALQNALNLALSGQAQVQSPVQSNVSQLGSQLAGLRTVTTTGRSSGNYDFFTSPFTSSLLQAGGTAAGGYMQGMAG